MISADEVKHIAKLARLELSEEEVSKYSEQLSKVIQYFNQLNEIDTNQIEELLKPSPLQAYARADEVKPGLTQEQVIANAPESSGYLIKVPPVV